MHAIIDTASDIGRYAQSLADAGVRTVIRYYNNRNGPAHPTKCLTAPELAALHGAGLSVAVVFEQRGGADGEIGDLSPANGTRDGTRALALATALGQPHGSGIYFAVDWDYVQPPHLSQIAGYFTNARAALGGAYTTGVYGSGLLGRRLRNAGLVEHIWLAASGWSGVQAALAAGDWSLYQQSHNLLSPIGGFRYDGNVVNAAQANFGQFGPAAPLDTPRGEGSAALFRVIARSGLNLRAGPGETFRVFTSLPADTMVTGLGTEGAWTSVDLDGDGQVDGYVFSSFLKAVSGGLPPAPDSSLAAASRKPIDIARQELARGVAEVPGGGDNPRIVMYHASTSGGASPDAVPWCSSFLVWCVEQAGLRSTNSKAARSWHNQNWGVDTTASPQVGDIAVFSRTGGGAAPGSGHVGFYLDSDANSVQILGGNQGNRVSIGRYPKNGPMGSYHYQLLSIRRG
ncbi:MAG TPA: TIGR02594 family protein [Xanthobacteraceae bacterium]|nr:TIGR02594 family protein [Xanthobacteraceae bacterium]